MQKARLTGLRFNPLATLVAGLIIGLVLGYVGRPLVAAPGPGSGTTPPEPTAPASAETASPMDAAVARTRHFKGSLDAPVTIIEFGDFQCPFCGQFARETAPLIEETYVATGQVRFGYLHFAFLGSESLWAAEASECAAEQGAFWAYHDLLYQRQAGESRGAFSKENLKGFAQELGLDTAAFDECVDSGRYTETVFSDTSFVESVGVLGTPAFLINGRLLTGALPFDRFAEAIDDALEETDR